MHLVKGTKLNPEQYQPKEPNKVNKGIYYPEMGEKSTAEITYKVGHYGKYYLTTALYLKGRGVKQVGDGSNHARGLNTYTVTELALSKLKEAYSVSYEAYL